MWAWELWQVAVILAGVSVLYNEAVALVNKRTGGNHPLAAAEVVIGTMYTIAGAWLVDGDCVHLWTLFWCFVASGTPMIVGDVTRWLEGMR